MMYVPDALDLFTRHDAEQEAALAKLPVCDICGEHIQEEHCFQINDEIICEHCMVEYFRKDTADLIGG